MQLISPDVLAAAQGLSPAAAFCLLVLGVLLWGAGWRYHRFFVVFAITLGAGVAGLSAGRQAAGQQVLVVGVLVALAAGVLALELAKLLAFVSGGVAAWVGAQAVVPDAQELWAVFLSGALIGVVLYRVWTMLVTGLVGTLVAAHAGLAAAGTLFKFDCVKWAASHPVELNGAAVAIAVFGVVVQARTAPKPQESPAEVPADADEPLPLLALNPMPAARRSWAWLRA